MKVLLLGAKGYLGSYLANHLNCDIATGRWGRGAPREPEEYNLVINCIAKTDMQWCEEHPLESFNVNAAFILDLKSLYPRAKIINFSSYYVYSTSGLATETSTLALSSLTYINHKILAEDYNYGGITFRIGKLFGNPYSTQNRLTEYIIGSPSLSLDSAHFNPCSCKCVLKALQNQKLLSTTGIYNLANKGLTDPVKYAKFILDKLKVDKPIEYVWRQPFPNYGKFAMSLNKIQQHLVLDPWEKDMEEYLRCTVLAKS